MTLLNNFLIYLNAAEPWHAQKSLILLVLQAINYGLIFFLIIFIGIYSYLVFSKKNFNVIKYLSDVILIIYIFFLVQYFLNNLPIAYCDTIVNTNQIININARYHNFFITNVDSLRCEFINYNRYPCYPHNISYDYSQIMKLHDNLGLINHAIDVSKIVLDQNLGPRVFQEYFYGFNLNSLLNQTNEYKEIITNTYSAIRTLPNDGIINIPHNTYYDGIYEKYFLVGGLKSHLITCLDFLYFYDEPSQFISNPYRLRIELSNNILYRNLNFSNWRVESPRSAHEVVIYDEIGSFQSVQDLLLE